MTDAPLAASVAASGSVASAARQSTPSASAAGRFRDTARTGDAQPGQVRGESTADLAGPEHHVQPILAHDRVLSPPRGNPGGR